MTMVILFFIVLGFISYTRLTTDLFPKVNIPFITVVVPYPGAGPKEVESQVVKPVEEALSSIGKLKQITSVSKENQGIIILEFNMDSDTDIAAIDVQKKVDGVRFKLPEGSKEPIVSKVDFNANPILNLGLSGSQSPEELYRYADEVVKERLMKVAGVADITLIGGRQREIQVRVDNDKLKTYNLSINQVLGRILAENQNTPSGRVEKNNKEYLVRVMGEFASLEKLADLEIPTSNGNKVTLGKIAQVEDGFQEVFNDYRLDKQGGVALIIQKQSDASVVTTVDAIKKELDDLQGELPSEMKITVAADSSVFIENSLSDTQRNLIEGILMTGLVLFFFLREWRSTFIVLLAIPTSMVATFLMMYLAGYSFNLLTLMGLTLAVGILVDDSIVVLENIHRHLKMGKSPWQAAIDGRKEIGMAAVAITLSDVVVFLPIAFMSGMVGQFFQQFGLTVVFATLFSLFVSFTLTPLLASRVLKPEDEEEDHPAFQPTQLSRRNRRKRRNPIHKLTAWTLPIGHWASSKYQALLPWALNHRRLIIIPSLIAFLGAAALIPFIGNEFMPKTDQSRFTIGVELEPGTPLEETEKVMRGIEDKIKKFPEVLHMVTVLGYSTPNYGGATGPHTAYLGVELVPKDERSKSLWEIKEEARQMKLSPRGNLTFQDVDNINPRNEPPFNVILTGADQKVLADLSRQLQAILEKTPGLVDVDSNYREGKPELQVQIDRQKAASYGLTVNDVAMTVRSSLEGANGGVLRTNDEEVDIRVQIDNLKKQPDDLNQLLIKSPKGELIKLSQVAAISNGEGPSEINRTDRQQSITLRAGVQGRALGDIVAEVEPKIKALPFPPGYGFQYHGEIKDMQDTNLDMFLVFGLSIALVYMLLTMLYESFLTPVIRMFTLPLGLVGALTALFLTGNTLNMMSLIGIIMLDGLVAKNGTLLIDYTNSLQERGAPLREALLEAAKTRLRPIAMTTLTMIFGMLPTALALSEGAEFRSSMAIVLIGGLITSTFFTLVVIPVAYTLIDDFKNRLRKGSNEKVRHLSNKL